MPQSIQYPPGVYPAAEGADEFPFQHGGGPKRPPSREEFDAAARQVAATAPAGLSREQFYALVDKALAAPRETGPGSLSLAKHRAAGSGQDTPEGGPTFLQRLGAGFGRSAQQIQNPTPGQQLVQDLLPIGMGAFGRPSGGPLPERLPGVVAGTKAAAKVVAQDVPIVRRYGPAVEAFKAEQAKANQPPPPKGLDRFMPNVPGDYGPIPPAPSGPEGLLPLKASVADLVDRYMPNQGAAPSRTPTSAARVQPAGSPTAPKAVGATPAAPNASEAPRLVKVLADAVSDAGKPAPVETSGTTPPPRTITAGGKPSVTQAEYDALQGTKAAQPSGEGLVKGKPVPKQTGNAARDGSSSQEALPTTRKTAGTKNVKINESNTTDLEKHFSDVYGSDAPTKGNGTDPEALTKALQEMRRKFGADRVAKLTAPDAPEVGVGKIVKATGAPSAAPDVMQKALLEHIKNPGQIKDMGRFLRGLVQVTKEYKRNGGVANSDVAREVAAALKKYGFEVPE